jgi:DNA polymerase III epsilon subunit-like protein
MTALCFLDTETTGVHPERKVWEVAMIRREDSGIESSTSFFVEVNLQNADPFGLKVGRFYDRHPLGRYLSLAGPFEKVPDTGETPDYYTGEHAAREVARCTHGAHIVGAVPNFDTEVLAELLRWHGLTPAWHYHLIDVEALAIGYLSAMRTGGPEWRSLRLPWDSDALSRQVGVEPASDQERHTALGDARWAMRLYDAIVKQS